MENQNTEENQLDIQEIPADPELLESLGVKGSPPFGSTKNGVYQGTVYASQVTLIPTNTAAGLQTMLTFGTKTSTVGGASAVSVYHTTPDTRDVMAWMQPSIPFVYPEGDLFKA